MHAQRGDVPAESSSLERWLQIQPAATRALERLAELARQAGKSDRVAELRRKKSRSRAGAEAYWLLLWRDEPLRTAAELNELARLAEAAGCRVEARALCHLALAADPAHVQARMALSRLEEVEAGDQTTLSLNDELWPSASVAKGIDRPEQRAGKVCGLAFTDDARGGWPAIRL